MKNAPAKARSLRRAKVPRIIAGSSSQPVIVAPQPFHAVSPLSGLDCPTTTSLPFSRAVMSPPPHGQPEIPSFATLAQGPPSNPLTPPDSPRSAPTTLLSHSAQYASLAPGDRMDRANQSQESLQRYCHSEGSPASPPASPPVQSSGNISQYAKSGRAPSAETT